MKKCVIILLLSLCLVGCQTGNNIPSADEASTPTTATQTGYACHNIERYQSPEAYNSFIEGISTHRHIPNDFITYDQLKILGEFRSLSFSPVYDDEWKYYGYGYSFTDSNGFVYELSMNHKENIFKEQSIMYEVNDQMNSMADALTTEVYGIVRNGKRYNYAHGRLVGILWEENNIVFYLSLYDVTENYPMDGETTFITRVLSLDGKVADAAFAELSASINQ